LTSLGHGPSETELYSIGQDGNVLGDDGLSLQSFDWEPKQPLMTLPMRPTSNMDDQQASTPVAFLDPSTLSNNPM